MINGTNFSYRFFAKPQNEAPPSYEIGALPEGYVQLERTEDIKSVFTTYQDEKGNWITFDYLYMEKGIGLGIDTQGAVVSDVVVKGCKGDFYFSIDGSKSNAVVWTDEDAGILFCLDMWAEKDEILCIAESVFMYE